MSDVEKIVSMNYEHRKTVDSWMRQFEEEATMREHALRRAELRRAVRKLVNASYVAAGAFGALACVYALTGHNNGALAFTAFAAVFFWLARVYAEDAQ